jgi:hypothetical protein
VCSFDGRRARTRAVAITAGTIWHEVKALSSQDSPNLVRVAIGTEDEQARDHQSWCEPITSSSAEWRSSRRAVAL